MYKDEEPREPEREERGQGRRVSWTNKRGREERGEGKREKKSNV
jgi:hypothetical protein